MNNKDIIKTHYTNLAAKFGLTIQRESYSPKFMGNAEVVYTSNTTGIQIVVDRSQALVSIGKILWPEESWFELTDVMRYYAPEEEAYVFFDKERNERVSVETQVIRTTQILEQYCRPLLEGDFTYADQIRELEAERVSEMLERFRNISRKEKTDKEHYS